MGNKFAAVIAHRTAQDQRRGTKATWRRQCAATSLMVCAWAKWSAAADPHGYEPQVAIAIDQQQHRTAVVFHRLAYLGRDLAGA